MSDKILQYISSFIALMLVLPIHEFAHAFAAVKSGDITPKINKRYTLNPLAHFDILGLLCFVFGGFGWAKPVPVNPNNFKHYKRDSFFVAIAGVSANYLLAFIAYPIFILSFFIPEFGYFTQVLQNSLLLVYMYSLSFFVFNLLPIYPLDGFRVIDVFSKKRSAVYRFLRDSGRYVLLFLIILGVISDYTGIWQLDVLGIAINFMTGIIGYPISAFWGLIF